MDAGAVRDGDRVVVSGADALTERLFGAVLATMDLHTVYLGDRLGYYRALLKQGVRIFEYQPAILHAKTLVADDYVSVVGSTNLDYRSIEFNCELSVIIRNPQFGRHVMDLFENDVCYAKRITLQEWRRRPFSDRFVQWAVKRARYLL